MLCDIPGRTALALFLALSPGERAMAAENVPAAREFMTKNENATDDALVDRETRAACEKAAATPIPSSDRPSPAEEARPTACKSSDLYYGIKVSQDYAAARKCAYVERGASHEGDFAWDVSGPAVLAMLYANGYGVARNLNLALKFACESGGAPAEIEGRVAHIQKLRQSPDGKTLEGCDKSSPQRAAPYCQGALDICDDATSGAMGGVCASIASDIDEQKAAAEFGTITRRFTAEQAAAFAGLEEKAAKYFNAHASNEIDLSGTARGQFYIEERDAMLKTFRATVSAFESGRVSVETQAALAAADKKLNEVYARVLKQKFYGTIEKDGVRTTQRSWLPYRDAWLSFAGSRYPNVSPQTVQTLLTRNRIKTLEDIPHE